MARTTTTRANPAFIVKFIVLVLSLLVDQSLACARNLRKPVSLRKPYHKKKVFRIAGKCVDLNPSPVCSYLSYNTTFTPNILKHKNQELAGREVELYSPLVKVKCSPQIQAFLCSVFFPICSASNKILLPCKSLCESARQGCEPLMNKFGFKWPAEFGCHMFPEKGDCFLGDLTEDDVEKLEGTNFKTNKKMHLVAMETKDEDKMKLWAKKRNPENKTEWDILEDLVYVKEEGDGGHGIPGTENGPPGPDKEFGPDGESIMIVLTNEDKSQSTICIEGDYNCRNSTVRSYINGQTTCCMDGKSLAYEWFCGDDGNHVTFCICVYPKPPGPGC